MLGSVVIDYIVF